MQMLDNQSINLFSSDDWNRWILFNEYNRTNRKTKNVWSKGSKRVQLRKGKQIKHTHIELRVRTLDETA